MLYFVISLTLINIVLWIILLVRFKKLFSTESIVEKTRAQMNHMIADIDKATDRNMYLLREGEKRLKDELAEADKKMELFRQATERLRDMIAEADRINKASGKNVSQNYSNRSYAPPSYGSSFEKKAVASYLKEKSNNPLSVKKSEIDPDSSFELNSQGNLFAENEQPIIKNETTVTEDGAAYREVPLIITKVYDEENNSTQGQTLSEQVKNLFEQGYTAQEIATQLSCSITEAQFIIDMI